ncbi:hypothetical protein FCM35_KLT14106 [Carex littledalei]|uniref:KIB1-4 beta-propeller domain-containing protein n=1 Tax=Carex littledalei TaxID=544730 RepID=A0A833QCW3_9POAL|nr:hypothetical protein FCM35_KLT14106 [Carex littledalei]
MLINCVLFDLDLAMRQLLYCADLDLAMRQLLYCASSKATIRDYLENFHFEFDSTFLREKLFIGSQYGFVAVLDQYSEPSLFNPPLTGDIISLPSITTVQTVRPFRSANGYLVSYLYCVCITNPESPFERYAFEHFQDIILFQKIMVSSNPSISSSSFVAAALIGPNLAIAMPGKGRWNLLERKCYMDIMFR